MSLIFGYTQDQSENPTYDQALQFGVTYTLPVFQGQEYSHKNHLSPTRRSTERPADFEAIPDQHGYRKNNENRVEKNIGINYVYTFWNPCLLGIGHCETISKNACQERSETTRRRIEKNEK